MKSGQKPTCLVYFQAPVCHKKFAQENYNITSKIFVFLAKKFSNTKITRRLAGIRLSANSKKPQGHKERLK